MQKQSGPSKSRSNGGTSWTPERRAKFMATIAAKGHRAHTQRRRPVGPGRLSMPELVLARRLKRQVVAHIAADRDVGEMETTILLLVNALLSPRGR